MPKTKSPPVSSRRRHKVIRNRISAAINLPEDVYKKALSQAQAHHDGNFSAYVRSLLRKDLTLRLPAA